MLGERTVFPDDLSKRSSHQTVCLLGFADIKCSFGYFHDPHLSKSTIVRKESK